MKFKYVVFDFDGVVCDSTKECMVTAWNAWERWNKRSGFRSRIEDFSKTEIESFIPLRPYVRGAEEYFILMHVINSSDLNIGNQQEYDDLRLVLHDKLDTFKEVFFSERDRLRRKDMDSWIKLHHVYNDVILVMRDLHKQGRLIMATFKDYKSVRMILKKNGVDISPKDIMDESQISSKLDALNYVVSKKKIKKEDLCFIDDNVTHLIEPNNNNYKVFLSGWGNTMTEHKKIANDNNISILNKILLNTF